jgi:muramoyltetrapeptide carboxypeptidase
MDGIILFIEDTGEEMSKVDRMLHNIEVRRLQSHIRAVVVGQFNKYKHPENGFDDMYAMLHEYLQHWHIPVCYDFPTGHAHLRNFPLLTGANATLDVSNEAVVLRYDN